MIGRLALKAGSNFLLPMLCLPRERRQALLTVYAFCRQTDDIVDSDDGSDVLHRLDKWSADFQNALRGQLASPILSATASVVKRFAIPIVHFEELIEGVRRDARGIVFETEAELKDYCRMVAGSVGLMAIRIMGTQSRAAQDYAIRLGEALQLTNILRDFQEDRRRGRVYFPNHLLARHGLDRAAVLALPDESRLLAMFESVCDRVDSLYDEASAHYARCRTRYLIPAFCMQEIYHAIFREIRADVRQILAGRVQLSFWKRIQIVSRTMVKGLIGS